MIVVGAQTAKLVAHAKALRKAHEAAGATVTLDGIGPVTVDTEGDDLAKLTGLFVRVQAGMQTPPLAFKGGGRFHHLTVAQLGVVVEGAAAHVNAGYAAEATVGALIEEGTARNRAEVEAAFAAALADELGG